MRIIIISFLFLLSACDDSGTNNLQEKVALGEQLFFDTLLSKNKTQSCSTCHNPSHGFIDSRDNSVNGMASLGDDGKSLGDRNTPTASYAKFSPKFHFDNKNNQWIGGQFLDGREATLTGQAGGPPTNPAEMGMPSKKALVIRLKQIPKYQKAFQTIYGSRIFDNVDNAYLAMADSIAQFEKTEQFSPFDSKYDLYLQGKYELTDLEDLGKSLFFSNNNTNCSSCHQLHKSSSAKKETFSNYEYHNIGVPVNTALRNKNGISDIDQGLLNNPAISDPQSKGKFKVPTLRNIAVTAPYMHNGVFTKLPTVIAFYDKYINKQQTINPETQQPWQPAEVVETINNNELKKGKKLTPKKISALVAFLNTLTDKRYEHLIPK
jgi:cytochrome c peroxidase